MNKALNRLKPGAPKIVLILLGASLWAFAAYRILKSGISMIEHHALHHWLNYLIGLAGFIPFFLGIFRKVSKRYLSRIIHHRQEKPCVFAFFDLKGYLIMTFMITMGILFSRWSLIPDIYKGTFFISLGLSLLASAIVYLVEGTRYMISRRSGTT